MFPITNFIIGLCTQTTNTNRWNSFLNYGIKNPVNESYNVHVFLRNEAQYPVTIFKTNYDTMEQVVQTVLGIGERRKFSCFVGDTFTAKVTSPGTPYDNLLLLSHDVSRVYVNDINMCDDTKIEKCDKEPFVGDMRWTPPDSLMFSNLLDYNISLYYWDGSCEEHIETLTTRQDYHIMSTIGHTFRMRSSNADKLLLEYKFEEIIINGLEESEYEISEKATALFDVILLEKLKESVETQKLLIEQLESKVGNC